MILAELTPQARPEAGPDLPSKIQPHHQDRLAVVYVRQSTARQVLDHRESTALQYNLRRRALAWGWPPERVLVIDEDQGHSGQTAEGRLGFQRLLAEVSLDHVGLILGIEMSRLARSNKDWHQLLELCAVFHSLLADQDGLYDPQEYNDRLLLGLKGTLSEAELHILRQRMYQGLLNKARRGEVFNHPSLGYIRQPDGGLALDPDEQVQSVVRLIFDQFDVLGTINALLRFLARHQIRLPIRPFGGPERGQLQWRRPNRQTLTCLLRHPLYAGAYVWGRRAVDPRRKIPGRPSTGRQVVPPEQCLVFLKDRCPAYITWDRYEANRQRITQNQARGLHPGPIREGPALLKGLVICGRCGCRMLVQYPQPQTGPGAVGRKRLRYACMRHAADYGQALCQSLAGNVVDRFVAGQVLKALEPASLELSLQAAEDIQEQRATLEKHWRQRLERTGYEVDRAQRQYHAVEPENRLVARELERRWEQALLEQRQLQDQYDRFSQAQPTVLTEADRRLVQTLAQDIPRLWHDPETSSADRQMIVRQLIERVTVWARPNSQHVDLAIQWAGGYTSQHHLVRPVARYDQQENHQQLQARILELRDQNQTSAQIAEQLNREGFRPPKRRATFNASMVRALLSRHRRIGRRPQVMETQGLLAHEWWFTDLARRLDLPQPTLYSWMRRGWVHARQLPVAGGRWIIWADADELDRLCRLRHCPRSWHNQPQAAELTRPKPRTGLS